MKQTLIALVEDKPGVLNRVASMFRRRSFNIESLAVGHSETDGVSRMTLVTDEYENLRRNIIKQNLLRMVNVISVDDVSEKPCVIRETALIKVKANAASRSEIMNISEIYRARIVDVGSNSMIVEVTGDTEKVDSIADLLAPFGILEIARTGQLAMVRGDSQQKDTSQNTSTNGHNGKDH